MREHEYIFAYGTLRPPQTNTPANDSRYFGVIADYVQSHTRASLTGAELYDLGAYPAATPGNGVIQGDLLLVAAAALPITDQIEGHPTFYRRAQVTVETAAGQVQAWIYWAPPGLAIGRPRILNGDWLQRYVALAPPPAFPPNPETPIDPVLRALVQRFAAESCSWLSSVRPDGRAHSAPIWHVWHQGRAYVVTPSTSVKAANIGENPNVVLTHPDPMNPIIIDGWARSTPTMREQLRPLFLEKYAWDIGNAANYDTVLEITPARLLAWGKYGEGKWPGTEVLRVG